MLSNYQIQDDKKYVEPRNTGLYIVGHEWKYSWWPEEVESAIELYNRGYSLTIIARRVKSTPRDTFLLLLDLAEKGRVKQRPGFLWGVA
jgi:hypothetical protein